MSRDAERKARLDAVMRANGSAGVGAPSRRSRDDRSGDDRGDRGDRARRDGSTASSDGQLVAPASGFRESAPRGPAPRAGGMRVLADRRGLGAGGILLVCLAGGFAGAFWDLSRGTRILGGVTATTFVIGAVIAALLAHREDIGASVVVPPLAYAVVVLVAAHVTGLAGKGSYTRKIASEVVVHVLTSAPGLLIAVGATIVIALVRWLAGRSAANRRRAAARAARAR